jgi:hypothetical protein
MKSSRQMTYQVRVPAQSVEQREGGDADAKPDAAQRYRLAADAAMATPWCR